MTIQHDIARVTEMNRRHINKLADAYTDLSRAVRLNDLAHTEFSERQEPLAGVSDMLNKMEGIDMMASALRNAVIAIVRERARNFKLLTKVAEEMRNR